ncbi:MAG: AMP-dependent synthetase and ligase [Acidobacteria bacterium]|nr:AMP-dependent synthetase and ligase [Acidobacteriota bacterium]
MQRQTRPSTTRSRRTPPRTFNEKFEEVVRRFPDRIAFRLKTPHGYTAVPYREAFRQSSAVAAAFTALDMHRGARVAVLSENRPEWVVAYLGIYFGGMIAVPLDTQISPQEWRRLIEDSGTQAVFVSGSLLPGLEEAVAGLPVKPRLISLDPVPGRDASASLAGLIGWAANIPNCPPLPECQPSDVVTIIYTSGTTGNPKGVMLTHANIVGELESIFGAIHADENDALLCLLPLQHVLASVINVLVPLYLGGQVVFADTLKRSEILQALQEAGITILATVPQFFYLFHDRIQEELSRKPAMMRRLFRGMLRFNRLCMQFPKINIGKILFPEVHRNFGSRLRLFVSGGSSFDAGVARDFHDMGFTVLQGYGLTETTGACAVTPVEKNVIGSVGPPLPGVDMRILSPNETGTGEILVRGPMVFKGYYNNPAATGEAVQEGWLRTGDLGKFDSGGNLFVTGRKKEVIVLPNGKNIYPDEVEAHYLRSPGIREIAVIGVFNAQDKGERLHAVVVPDFEYLKANRIANTREFLRDRITALSKSLLESAVGQEVISCLRETYHRDVQISSGMNLELDLGFDSMERIELLSSLEEALHLSLPEDFGADIHTVRDLVTRLEQQAGVVTDSGIAARQSWKTILSREPEEAGKGLPFHLSGATVAVFKHVCLRLVYYLVFRTLLRLKAHGLDNLPEKGPFLICPNHQSYLDPFILLSVLPYRVSRRMFFLGYSVFFQGWFMRLVAHLTNVISVDADAHLLRAMKAGAAGLRHGLTLGIFPEGGRSFDGELQTFKKGAAILSRELSVPIIPTAIRGTHKVWPRDSIRIRPHRVSIEFGEPLFPSQNAVADPYQADTDRLREAVASLIS